MGGGGFAPLLCPLLSISRKWRKIKMAVNVINLEISAPSCRKWEKKQTAKSYVEYQKLRFAQCGKLQTQTLRIISRKNGDAYIVTASGNIKTTVQAVLNHMAEILEFGRKMPLLENVQRVSVSYSGNLPEYGQHEKSRAEEYAERLREDRWDVRRLGDPSDWRLVRI